MKKSENDCAALLMLACWLVTHGEWGRGDPDARIYYCPYCGHKLS